MTDYRKRLERLASGERPLSVYPIRAVDPADDMLKITVFDALQHAADLRKLLSEEAERLRSLVEEAGKVVRETPVVVIAQAAAEARGEDELAQYAKDIRAWHPRARALLDKLKGEA